MSETPWRSCDVTEERCHCGPRCILDGMSGHCLDHYPGTRSSSLRWRHNERNGVSNHLPHDGLLNRLFSRTSKKTSKLRVTGLCEGDSPVTGEFPAQSASNAENVSIWWRHHGCEVTATHWKIGHPWMKFTSARSSRSCRGLIYRLDEIILLSVKWPPWQHASFQ